MRCSVENERRIDLQSRQEGEGALAIDKRLLAPLEWRCIGPFRGGRSATVAGHPTERQTFFFGACAYGVWKTTDGGIYWENISDGWFNTAAVGAVAVSESDPAVVYAGTGEACIRGNVAHGDRSVSVYRRRRVVDAPRP